MEAYKWGHQLIETIKKQPDIFLVESSKKFESPPSNKMGFMQKQVGESSTVKKNLTEENIVPDPAKQEEPNIEF